MGSYMLSNEQMKELAERKDGKIFLELSQCARSNDIGILYGYPELDEVSGLNVYYNSIQFIDKCGRPLANYRKIHLWIDSTNVERMFTPGEKFEVVEFCGMKMGLLICYDVEICEAVRILALRGVETVLVPTACPYQPFQDFLIPSRAFENGVYVAYVNHGGGTFAGKSVCSDSDGNILVCTEAKEEGIFLVAVKRKSKKTQSHLNDRRPDLYKEIVSRSSCREQ